MMEKERIKKLIHIITLFCSTAAVVFVIYGYQRGLFTNREFLEGMLKKAGIWAPLTFILIQIMQVVVPIIPGGITCAVGVLIFGPWFGLLYNYIGIAVGSGINFYLARTYGKCLVKVFVKEKTYDKYITWLDKGKKFDIFFALAIFFPCAPDDVLCWIAGLTKMSWKRFSAIILLGKPASIAVYSMALIYMGGLIL